MRALRSSTSPRELGSHFLHGLKLFAGDEIHVAHEFASTLACAIARFAGHARKRASSTVEHLGEVGDEGVFALHDA